MSEETDYKDMSAFFSVAKFMCKYDETKVF